MAAYAVGILYDLEPHADLVEYLGRIDATLARHGGRFVIHGARPEVREGSFDARFIVIEFPSLDDVRAWYESPGYQVILPLRTKHSRSVVFFVEGIVGPHAATDVLAPGVHFKAARSGRART